MPRVEVLTEVSGRDPEAVLTEHAPSETLANEHDADQLVERMGWAPGDAEQRIKQFHPHDGCSAASGSGSLGAPCDCAAREQEAWTARTRQGDTEASIIDFLAQHPGSTAG